MEVRFSEILRWVPGPKAPGTVPFSWILSLSERLSALRDGEMHLLRSNGDGMRLMSNRFILWKRSDADRQVNRKGQKSWQHVLRGVWNDHSMVGGRGAFPCL